MFGGSSPRCLPMSGFALAGGEDRHRQGQGRCEAQYSLTRAEGLPFRFGHFRTLKGSLVQRQMADSSRTALRPLDQETDYRLRNRAIPAVDVSYGWKAEALMRRDSECVAAASDGCRLPPVECQSLTRAPMRNVRPKVSKYTGLVGKPLPPGAITGSLSNTLLSEPNTWTSSVIS